MTHAFVTNGETQLVLVPSNDLERLLLKGLADQDTELITVTAQTSLLGKGLSGGVIIRPKSKPPASGPKTEAGASSTIP